MAATPRAATPATGPPTDLAGQPHEQVVRFHDAATGLVAYVAIHSTALGPALGGTRFQPYPTEADALADVLRLAAAMSAKNAVAGLPHGGGKAVIVGDPATASPDLLHAYGRWLTTLRGRYVTAADVGSTVAHMDLINETCRYVTGRSPARGGGGDSGVLTALGVFQGMTAAAGYVWGEPTLAGRRVGVLGLGKVGGRLVGHLLEAGAEVVVADAAPDAVARTVAAHPQVRVVDPEALAAEELDVFSPNALGGALDERTEQALRASVVCGGANNQLPEPAAADRLAARGVLYVPDFVVNAGGVIQVADEFVGFDAERARTRALGIRDTTSAVLHRAAADGVTPSAAADRLAAERIAAGPWAGTGHPGLE